MKSVERWQRTLYIIFVVQLISALGFSSSFPFLSLYVQELDKHSSLSDDLLIGLAFSSQAFTMMLAAPLWGMIADRRGRKLMVMRAAFGAAVVVTLMGFVHSAEELIVLRGLQGLVTGVAPATMALVASIAPRERSGYAMGLQQMALWAGISLGPLMGGVIADAFGYEVTYMVTGGLLVCAGLLVWLGVDEEFTPPVIDKNAIQQRESLFQQWRSVIRMPGVKPTFGVGSLNWMVRSMLSPFTPLLVAALLVNSDQVATITGLIAGGAALSTTVSAFFMGRLSDKIGHRNILIGGTVAAAMLYLPQFMVSNVWQLGILQVLTGVAIGAIMPTISALLAGFTPVGTEGKVYGLQSSLTSGSRTLAPILGSIAVAFLGLRGVFLLAGIMFIFIAAIAIRHLPELPHDQPTSPSPQLAAKPQAA